MTYTTPTPVSAGDVLSASAYNTDVVDNITHLHAGKPASTIARNNTSDYSTSSTTFADVDATNLSVTLTTSTGRVLVAFAGTFYNSGGNTPDMSLDVDIDGSRMGAATDGIVTEKLIGNQEKQAVSFTLLKTGLSIGSHTFKLQWKATAGPVYLRSSSTQYTHFQIAEW